MSPVTRWVAREVHTPKTNRQPSLFDQMIPDELLRHMKRNPGVTYMLLDENGAPLVLTKQQASALSKTREPYRLQSRAADDQGGRHVWVSMDPAHWETIKAARVKAAKRK